MSHSKTIVALAALAVAATAAMGCASYPRRIDSITTGSEPGRNNQIKFLYRQGSEQGIVKCTVAPDGALSACRNMVVEFEE